MTTLDNDMLALLISTVVTLSGMALMLGLCTKWPTAKEAPDWAVPTFLLGAIFGAFGVVGMLISIISGFLVGVGVIETGAWG